MDKITCPFCEDSKVTLFKDTKFRRCEDCGLFINTMVRSKSELRTVYRSRMPSTCRTETPGENRMKLASRQLDVLETYTSPGIVYDVGAAVGFFMKVATDRDWVADGNELSETGIKWAKDRYDIDIEYGFLEELDVATNYYDVVVMWQTLEHMPNPKDVLIMARKMLKDGGLIFISLPNKQTLADLKNHYTEDHPFEFTEWCIEKWLKTLDFQEIEKVKFVAEQPPYANYLYRKRKGM